MQLLLKKLLTELHILYFKPNGFKKKAQRFNREKDKVMQGVDFQSSSWNSKGGAITFYVNIKIGFIDIPMKNGLPEMTGAARIDGLCSDCPPQFDLCDENFITIRDLLLNSLPIAMREVTKHYEVVRQGAVKGSHTHIS